MITKKEIISKCLEMMGDAYRQSNDMETYQEASFFNGQVKALRDLLEEMGCQVMQDASGKFSAIDWSDFKEA